MLTNYKTATAVTTTKKVEMTPEQKALNNLVAQATMDRKIAPVADNEYTKPVTYVTAGNGLFRVRMTPVALYAEKVEDFKTSIPGIPDMEAGVKLLIPKIPMKVAIELLSYYREIYDKDGTECSVLLFWNDRDVPLPNIPGVKAYDGEMSRLVAYCPKQTNSPTLSSFREDMDQCDWFRAHMTPLCESHSHQFSYFN